MTLVNTQAGVSANTKEINVQKQTLKEYDNRVFFFYSVYPVSSTFTIIVDPFMFFCKYHLALCMMTQQKV